MKYIKKRKRSIINSNTVSNIECDENQNSNNREWPKGTIAIFGDSIINWIMNEKLCGKGRNVNVKTFSWVNRW